MSLTTLVHHIDIRRTPQEVFDYVTTPGRWPEWHPSSLQLGPNTDRPLPAGARFHEQVRAGGRSTQLFWHVRVAERPTRWVADAEASNGAQLTLSYSMQPAEGGTRFERRLGYELPSPWLRLLNRLLLRRRIARESAESLRQLKQRMEAGA